MFRRNLDSRVTNLVPCLDSIEQQKWMPCQVSPIAPTWLTFPKFCFPDYFVFFFNTKNLTLFQKMHRFFWISVIKFTTRLNVKFSLVKSNIIQLVQIGTRANNLFFQSSLFYLNWSLRLPKTSMLNSRFYHVTTYTSSTAIPSPSNLVHLLQFQYLLFFTNYWLGQQWFVSSKIGRSR